MELFVSDQELNRLEAALPRVSVAERLDLLLQLAWHLRQRDCARSKQYAEQAQQSLSLHPLGSEVRALAEARLNLVLGEIELLQGDIEQCEALAQQALAVFQAHSYLLGVIDAYILLSNVANEHAQGVRRIALRKEALNLALQIGDAIRADHSRGMLILWEMLRDAKASMAQYQAYFPGDGSNLSPVVQAIAYHVLAFHASLASDFAQAITYWIKAYHAAVMSGQIRHAIITACNIGDAFNNLNEHQAALEWMQKGLAMARPQAWPSAVGLALCQCGETLRRLGRLDVASEMLHEALEIQHCAANTRVYASGFAYLADLALDRKEYASALQSFDELLARSDILQHPDLQIAARRGRAHALTALGQPLEALYTAKEARLLAQKAKDAYREIEVLKVLADIHAKNDLPPPPDLQEPNASLHYLQLARQLGEGIAGYTIAGDVYDAMGEAYLRANDLQKAYQSAILASKARDKTQSNEATKRAIALQVQLQTERALSLRAQQAQLASAEASRAQVLQQTSATLSRLCVIGQDITSQLDMEAVLESLARHVLASLEVHTLLIFLLDNQTRILTRALLYENGRSLPVKEISLDDPTADSARCAREKCEVLRDWSESQAFPNHIQGTSITKTSLFVPLLLGERVLGVMSVQSLLAHAFGEHERLIFRTLCAFGAIALDNALTYRQLQQAQQLLVSQEKLAALGGLVAGVAHELNTPIGNCLIITSALQDKAHQLEQKIKQGGLQRQDLMQFLQDTDQAGEILLRGLGSAAGLVASFKQVAVDRASAQQRRFDLLQTCSETVATMMNQIRIAGHHLELSIAPNIWMFSYPGPLGQVIAHMINNAIVHGFGQQSGGHMHLQAETVGEEHVKIVFSDDGVGIPAHVLPHVFEPFFSTLNLDNDGMAGGRGERSQFANLTGQTGGGCGLGLNISFNIVNSLLNGQIQVSSNIGQGTVFTLVLPRNAPAAS